MVAAEALRELLAAAAEAGARRALELAGQREPSSLVPIREAPVAYRAILAAASKGELKIHRRGKAGFVERADLERWIRAGSRAPKADDAIGELIDITRQRRRRAQ